MKTVQAVNTLEEFEHLVAQVGSLVPMSVARGALGVTSSRIYRLGEVGRLRVFAVFGVYQVPLSDIKKRVSSGGPKRGTLLAGVGMK